MHLISLLNTGTFIILILALAGITGYFLYRLIREILPTIHEIKEFQSDLNAVVSSAKTFMPEIQSIAENLNSQREQLEDVRLTTKSIAENVQEFRSGLTTLKSKDVLATLYYARNQLFKKRKKTYPKIVEKVMSGIQNFRKWAPEWLDEKAAAVRSGEIPTEDWKSPVEKFGRLLQRKSGMAIPVARRRSWWKQPVAFLAGGALGGVLVSLRRSEEPELQPRSRFQSTFPNHAEEQTSVLERYQQFNTQREQPASPDWFVDRDSGESREVSPRRKKYEKFTIRALVSLLKDTFNEWNEDKAPRLGAALSYYTIFSLAPILVVVIALAGLIFGQDAVQSRVMFQIRDLIGKDGAEAIQNMIQVARQPKVGFLATIIGIITLLLGASGVFGEIQDALNTIWHVPPKPTGGFLGMIRYRFTSFAMVLGIGFLLLASLVISAALAAVGDYIGNVIGFPAPLLQVLNFFVSFAVIALLFALLFKVVPDAEIAWDDVWIGAAVTSLLFTIGKFLIGLYLGRSSVVSAFGAAGSLVLILLWVYYSAQIVFFGAEFTKVYANRFGSKIRPENGERQIE